MPTINHLRDKIKEHARLEELKRKREEKRLRLYTKYLIPVYVNTNIDAVSVDAQFDWFYKRFSNSNKKPRRFRFMTLPLDESILFFENKEDAMEYKLIWG